MGIRRPPELHHDTADVGRRSDVDALFHEWLEKAYGPAAPTMKQFYTMIEERVLERKRNESPQYSGDNYEVNYDFVETVYKPIFPEMERLYLQALVQVKTEKQRKRLEMMGDNLVMLHYNLRKANMLKDAEKSLFYRTDADYVQFLRQTEFSLSMYRDHGHRDTPLLFHGSFSGQAENPPMEVRKVAVPRLPAGVTAPMLDGDLSDPAWQKAGVADQFRELAGRSRRNSRPPSGFCTTARLSMSRSPAPRARPAASGRWPPPGTATTSGATTPWKS